MINLNNGVANVKGTPAIITDTSTNKPTANIVANGTIYIESDTSLIYQSDGTSWLQIAPGVSQNLQNVLNTGNLAYDQAISLIYGAIQFMMTMTPGYIVWTDIANSFTQFLYPNPSYIGQKCYLAESNGTLQLQDPPLNATISTTPFTPSGTFNKIYKVVAGASSIVLNPANWIDRKTLIFCGDITYTFSPSAGASIKGQTFINNTGLIYVTFLFPSTFYISHI